jgi:uroporphyrinogen decarboxylase
MMTKMERVSLTIKGEQTDRIPYSFWTHFPGIDLDSQRLAEETYAFYRKLDLDFVKNMSNGMFSIEDWGCDVDFSQVALGGVAKVTKYAVEEASDWLRLGALDIECGALGRELKSLSNLLRLVKGEAPVLVTVFSPLTTAQKLSGARLVQDMKTDPDKVKTALDVITASTIRFALRALELGCAGVYFASQMSTYDSLTEAEYREFGVNYDLRVLQAIQPFSWFNVMHVHGNNIMFNAVKDYPVQGISWHVWETAPLVQEFLSSVKTTCIVGGLQRFRITNNLRTELSEEISTMAKLTGKRRLFLAPGCVIRAPFDWDTLSFIRQAITTASRT